MQLDDLMLTVVPGVELPWHAAVRRLPFIYEKDGINYPRTTPVDVAPDVIVLNPDPMPLVIPGEPPAIWVPRSD